MRFPPVIRTPRLLIRRWRTDDAAALQRLITKNLDHLRRWLEWADREPIPVDAKAAWLKERSAEFERGADFIYGMFDRTSEELLGSIGVHPRIGAGAVELGYWIRQDRTGKGLVTEAAAALTRCGFESTGISRIEIHCHPDNAASAAIPMRLGFRSQVTIKNCVRSREIGPRDTVIWHMTRTTFATSMAASGLYE